MTAVSWILRLCYRLRLHSLRSGSAGDLLCESVRGEDGKDGEHAWGTMSAGHEGIESAIALGLPYRRDRLVDQSSQSVLPLD